MRDREVDLQDLRVADLTWIERHLDGLRMSGRSAADGLVDRCVFLAAGITRDGALDALDVLEHALHAPEASARQHRDFGVGLLRRLRVGRESRDYARFLRGVR